MATTKNLFIDQGSSFSYSITATDENGTALNITAGSGYTATGQLRRSYYSLTSTSFSVGVTGATGNITFALGPTNTAALKPGRYVYDIELAFPTGKVVRQLQGTITIDPEVTK
jgi:hypothetical protein